MAESLEAVVLGAGVSGLCCARRIGQAGFRTVVLEGRDRVGGVIDTREVDGYLVETGPNTILPTPGAMEQIVEAGFDGEMVEAPRRAPRFVWIDGRLQRVPWVLSPRGLARVLGEPFVSRRAGDSENDLPADESAASFFRRRFGGEVHDRLAAPFVGGIYAGDTEKLSMAGAFPRLRELEARYGSVILGMIRVRRGAPRRYPLASFRRGMRTLGDGLSQGLDARLETPARVVRRDGVHWVVETDRETFRADAVVVATPAGIAAELLGGTSADLARLLEEVVYAPVVVVAASANDDAFPRPLSGFGFLVPPIAGLYTLGTLFNSCLFSGRAPEGKQLLTSFIGGALMPEVLEWSDDRIREIVFEEVEKVLSLPSGSIKPLTLVRYERAIPQYGVGHPSWKSAVGHALQGLSGLFLGGNYIEGISVPAAMENGRAVGERVASLLGRKR